MSVKTWSMMAFAVVLLSSGGQAAFANPVDYNFSATLTNSEGSVTGTFTYDSGSITNFSFVLPPSLPNPVSGSTRTLDTSDGTEGDLGPNQFRFYAGLFANPYFTLMDLYFTSVAGVLQFDPTSGGIVQRSNVTGNPVFFGLFADGAASPVNATPLPAALPLFASGIGALGLFGWRRRRKAALAA